MSDRESVIPCSAESSLQSPSNMDQHFEDLFMIVKQRFYFFLFKKNFLTKSLPLLISTENPFLFFASNDFKNLFFDPSF